MSVIAAYERAQHLPLWRRWIASAFTAAVAYTAIAAVAIGYLLPTGFGLTGSTLLLAQLGVAVAGAAILGVVMLAQRRGVRHRALLWSLCAQLGWAYTADIGDRPWGGSIDEQIDRGERTALDHIDARNGPVPFDAVRRVFSVGDGQGATVHTALCVRIPLPSEAPRIALRSCRGAGVLSVLPRRPRGRTELRLEGDFSDVFQVSVPAGYERDALYVLTPDLMAILLDTASDLDLEIVDSTLHVYLPEQDLTDAAGLGRLLTMVSALYERFGRQTQRYRDEAAPPLDAQAYRRSGDTLSRAARALDTRVRVWPVLTVVLTPLVPVLLAVLWMQFYG